MNKERELEELLKRTASYGSAEIETGRDRLRREWAARASRESDWRDALETRMREGCGSAERCVRRHPWKSLGMAFLAGAALAACLSRRDA
ncbi:hypothetical protein PIGHUM_02867 [Pigmentiphaga humi]|uniref:DUF883 domain-containing protein n=1 Tax=Pigmentiphaga humi TaxID=2478468 RepID=A0A3P4B554_9BURK|nr:DUF883 family protein [Pigmentiphaga humi]VCU70790.1 hypothetical protein PIGHUM_02867 [Pigmentiphaga humi]